MTKTVQETSRSVEVDSKAVKVKSSKRKTETLAKAASGMIYGITFYYMFTFTRAFTLLQSDIIFVFIVNITA